jgi:hypothetical protein
MNEIARFAEHAIADAGGLARCDVGELNREQRQMLHNRDGRYAAPLELVSERRRRGWPCKYSKSRPRLVIWNILAWCGFRGSRRTASRCCRSTVSTCD